MGCVPARACQAALAQASARWYGRNKASDGICGDPRHQARVSDHNAGNAFDLTHDPANGVDTYAIADWLRSRVLAGQETRVKYIISNRRIFNPTVSPAWRSYSGSNPHTKHMHVSILPGARDDMRAWWDGFGLRPQGKDMPNIAIVSVPGGTETFIPVPSPEGEGSVKVGEVWASFGYTGDGEIIVQNFGLPGSQRETLKLVTGRNHPRRLTKGMIGFYLDNRRNPRSVEVLLEIGSFS